MNSDGTITPNLNSSSGLLCQYVYGSSTTAPTTTDGSVAGGDVAGYLQSEELLDGTSDPSPNVIDSYTYYGAASEAD